jgi:hypothetical protein
MFSDITSCKPLKDNILTNRITNSFHAGFLIRFFFDPEDGSEIFHRNVG